MYIETVAVIVFIVCVAVACLYVFAELRRYSNKRKKLEETLCDGHLKNALIQSNARLIKRWHSSIIIYHTFHTISKLCGILSVCFSIISLVACNKDVKCYDTASCTWISAASVVFVVIAVFLMPNRKIPDSSRIFKCCDYKLNKLIVEKELMQAMDDKQALTKGYEITAFIDRMEMSNISDDD